MNFEKPQGRIWINNKISKGTETLIWEYKVVCTTCIFFSKLFFVRYNTNQSCPVCRDHLEKQEDCWEFADLPDLEEINEKVVELATGDWRCGKNIKCSESIFAGKYKCLIKASCGVLGVVF